MADVKPPSECYQKGDPKHDRLAKYCDICRTGYEYTINDDGVECPYCGYVDRDAWEWADEDQEEHECGRCELKFMAYKCVSVDYRTEPLTAEERGHSSEKETRK